MRQELGYIQEDPLIDALMRVVSGMVAVLNEHRQVLALNTRMLQFLGIHDAGAVLGLRLGEVVGCTHAGSAPGGCGTTTYCSTCGAAVAQVTSLAEASPVERTCAIDVSHPVNGADHLFFRIQASPLWRSDRRLLLLFIQDISEFQQHAALDRTFSHDVKNTLCAVLTAAELVADDASRPNAALAASLVQVTRRLAREIELQRCLTTHNHAGFEHSHVRVSPVTILREVAETCAHHPEANGRSLQLDSTPPLTVVLDADPVLLSRVVQNMVINALEATPVGGLVRLWVDAKPDSVAFCVWNAGVIPTEIAGRVFQRNFSTKAALGRGLGTYSMKLIGERMLRGHVSFTSELDTGTCFRFALPTTASNASPAETAGR